MSSFSPIKTAGTIAAVAATGFLGYAIYFDYMRRNSPEFRKSLRKQQKKLAAVAEANAKARKDTDTKALREGYLSIQTEKPPTTPEQQEAYFAEEANQGEQLITKGEEFYVEAALHFFRALRVYHSPGELLAVYQRVVPPAVLEMIIQLVAMSTSRGAPGAALSSNISLETPAQPPASVEDIDDAAPEQKDAHSSNSTSQGSGADWEKVSSE
ncbi:uncharacterized protein L203_101448 [Cryptococcus depauperatus CBS 7841]|uniref:Uncharacterized protein n=1 Tax=Cryptococcus depauperatus CBS 7841 TaxID=1295531 RepID=A0A1E3ITS5_9TREE|nr:hypothetical protein L203_01192 [Cryptococcus depauperatus CBS 7841]ODN94419.1 hypothetical protein L204_04550 [Cryptococcus depauperatus CBS 7855]